jgi:hypothetical protein
MAQSRRSGVALSVMDGFFAATALAKDLTLVTRNVKDHSACRCLTRGTNEAFSDTFYVLGVALIIALIAALLLKKPNRSSGAPSHWMEVNWSDKITRPSQPCRVPKSPLRCSCSTIF